MHCDYSSAKLVSDEHPHHNIQLDRDATHVIRGLRAYGGVYNDYLQY